MAALNDRRPRASLWMTRACSESRHEKQAEQAGTSSMTETRRSCFFRQATVGVGRSSWLPNAARASKRDWDSPVAPSRPSFPNPANRSNRYRPTQGTIGRSTDRRWNAAAKQKQAGSSDDAPGGIALSSLLRDRAVRPSSQAASALMTAHIFVSFSSLCLLCCPGAPPRFWIDRLDGARGRRPISWARRFVSISWIFVCVWFFVDAAAGGMRLTMIARDLGRRPKKRGCV